MTESKRSLGWTVGFGVAVAAAWAAQAQDSKGLKFNNLTVSPYVNVEVMYDSNVNYRDGNGLKIDDMILRVSPGADFTYQGNEWGLSGNAWYGYDWYQDLDNLNGDRYGERVSVYKESSKGWRFVLGESYIKTFQEDSILDGGRGVWRDRSQFDVNSALSYEFSERMGATLSAMYSDLSYQNLASDYSPLYGWQEWSVALELSRKISEKSNVLLSGAYQDYTSDGAIGIRSDSTGYSLQAGFGSRATERIHYRVLTGASWFDYAGGQQLSGWTYSVDGSWVVNKRTALTIAGSSYYQPSETYMNSATKVYALSAGLTYKPMRKLSTRFDIGYRREESDYGMVTDEERDDRFSVRLRADYQLMRYVTLYGGLEYEDQNSSYAWQTYDRYRASLGLNFRY